MFLFFYKISMYIAIIYLMYLLKHINKLHMREKARIIGSIINRNLILILSEKKYLNILNFIKSFFILQLISICELITGFCEGLINYNKQINFVSIEDKNIQTDLQETIVIQEKQVEVIKEVEVVKEVEVFKEVYNYPNNIKDNIINNIIEYIDINQNNNNTTLITESKDNTMINANDGNSENLDKKKQFSSLYEKYKNRGNGIPKIIQINKKNYNVDYNNKTSPFIRKDELNKIVEEDSNNLSQNTNNIVNYVDENDDGSSLTSLVSLTPKNNKLKKILNISNELKSQNKSKRKSKDKMSDKQPKIEL